MTEERSQNITQDKLDQIAKSWSRMIDCIIHDLTTPLALTRMVGASFRKILPDLIAGYQLAVEGELLSEPTLNEKNIQAFSSSLVTATGENINNMFEFLSALRPLCKNLFSTSQETVPLSAKTSIEAALARYPFANNNERSIIRLNCTSDFQFKCAPIFIECLFDHLLSHAMSAIHDAGKGDVDILIAADNNGNNKVYFKVNAKIDNDFPEDVFGRFFLKDSDNTIIPELGFCRLALLQRGGDISCYVVDGSAEFTIELPK